MIGESENMNRTPGSTNIEGTKGDKGEQEVSGGTEGKWEEAWEKVEAESPGEGAMEMGARRRGGE